MMNITTNKYDHNTMVARLYDTGCNSLQHMFTIPHFYRTTSVGVMAGRLQPSMIFSIRIRDGWHDSRSYMPRSLTALSRQRIRRTRNGPYKAKEEGSGFGNPNLSPSLLPLPSNRIFRYRAYLTEENSQARPYLLFSLVPSMWSSRTWVSER